MIKKEASKTARLAKVCILWGLPVILVGCATPDQLESLKKEFSSKLEASQLEHKKETEAQLKTQEDLEAKIVKVRAEILKKTQAQEDQLSSQVGQLRGELDEVRERVSSLIQIEADVREILNQTRNMQAAFKNNLRVQATLLKEHLEVIETTLKGMETTPPKSPQ